MMKKIVVLYHNDCFDGFAGAWVMWKKFGNQAEYIALKHQSSLPKNLKNKEIYFVDFCYPEKLMKEIFKNNRKVIVIDHHISRKEAVKISSEYIYDINHSGSILAWKYVYPKKPIPKLLRHIEDADLWKFKSFHTQKLLASLMTYKFDFRLWDKIAADFEKPKTTQKYLDEGKAIFKYQGVLGKWIAKNAAEKVKFKNYTTYAVNSPVLASEIGSLIVEKLKKADLAIVWYNCDDGRIRVSLISDGKVDVSKLAQKYGGGGHRAVAGFMLDKNKKLPWHKLK